MDRTPTGAAVPANALDAVPGQRGGPARPASIPRPRQVFRPRHLLPTPAGTPFTFGYGALLAVTSAFASYAPPALTHALYQASSTDAAHLLRAPVPVLVASALWVAGGVFSPFTAAFVLALTALERRVGAARAFGVFLAGHVLATLATELPVGGAVLLGDLPPTSLHRLDYGISFGVAAVVAALCGLLRPRYGYPLLALVAAFLLHNLLTHPDPMTNWGHLIALTIGTRTWRPLREVSGGPARSR